MNSGARAAILLFNMIDDVAYELGYPNGAQDLPGEEPCVNIEIIQIVNERLMYQLALRKEHQRLMEAYHEA